MRKARFGAPIVLGDTTIIPLEETGLSRESGRHGSYVYAFMRPIGIVVRSPSGQWAIDMTGRPVPIETYLSRVSGLREALDKLEALNGGPEHLNP